MISTLFKEVFHKLWKIKREAADKSTTSLLESNDGIVNLLIQKPLVGYFIFLKYLSDDQ